MRLLLFLLLSLTASQAFGQKQMVLLKGQKVLLRLNGGDEVVFKLKDKKHVYTSYVNNLNDTALIAHTTVIPYHKIERVYFDRANFMNVVGGLLVTAGVGYMAIDQINVVLVNGEEANVERNVLVPSIAMVAAGLPMMLIKKKSQKIGRRYRLRTVEEGSPFYR